MASMLQNVGGVGDKYEVVGNIGRGSFGIISKVKRKSDGKILCRKEINYLKMSTKEREQLQAEINILSSLRHPNIVSYYHREHLKESQDLHLYMEYCGGGDLSKIINKLAQKNELVDEAYVWNIMSQLVGALYRCHYGVDPPAVPDNVMAAPKGMKLRTKDQWTILHRDLKPENIFLGDDDSVKLGDFGLSKSIQGNDFASTYVGTPYYMSPEICAGERYSSKSDIWSMGCIIYELCTTRPPFDAKTHIELIHKIRQGSYKPISSVYSRELHNVIDSCLKVNPQKRPATCDLLDNPVVRLMRKEREIAEIGRVLQLQKEETEQMRCEAEALQKNIEAHKAAARQEIDDTLRREWEVRARLEIERQVKMEREAMSKKWDEEFPKHVAAAVETKMQEFYAMQAQHQGNQRSTSPDTVPTSSVHTSQSTADDFTTDLSSLSMMDSPFKEPLTKKRTTRTPFGREKARTQIDTFDSPMDVHMASPSPAAINSLSLSPRRGTASHAHLADTSKNLFAANARKQRWQPATLSPAISEGETFEDGIESEDDMPDLPSPTLARANDPFKSARPRVAARPRPSLGRQQTMPANRLGQQEVPTLFNKNGGLVSKEHTTRSSSPTEKINLTNTRSTSPSRERRTGGGLKSAKTEGDMHKDLMKRNAGRTLVELQHEQTQNRALAQQGDLVLPPKNVTDKENANPASRQMASAGVKAVDHASRANDLYADVAVWDPVDCEEMPSPFLNRNKGRGILPMR